MAEPDSRGATGQPAVLVSAVLGLRRCQVWDPAVMPPPADLATALDAWGLPARLIDLHRQRLILGLVGALGSVGFNLFHPAGPAPVDVLPVAIVTALYLSLGAGLVWIRTQMAQRPLAKQDVSLRDRALNLAAAVNRPANAWLAWAAVGHFLIALVAPWRLGLLGGFPGPFLWLLLLPTVGMLIHGRMFWPNRAFLLALDRRTSAANNALRP